MPVGRQLPGDNERLHPSKDFEDIVALLDGRHTIVDEVRSAPSGVRQFLADWCERVLASPWIADAIAGHVSRASGPGRVDLVLERMQRIAAQWNRRWHP